MINYQFPFILKILLLSLVLSLIVKYGGRLLPLNDNTPINTYALIAIVLPPFVMAIALGLRIRNNK